MVRIHLRRGQPKASVDGEKVGIILATINAGYRDPVVNKDGLEGLLNAKASGRLDHAFVVAAR